MKINTAKDSLHSKFFANFDIIDLWKSSNPAVPTHLNMKNLAKLLLLLTIVAACNKTTPEEPITPAPTPVDTIYHIIELGKASVLRNGIPWNADFYAEYYPNDKTRFWITGQSMQNGYDHYLSLDDIRCKVGFQKFEQGTWQNGTNGIPETDYFVALDGDQLFKTYLIDTTRSNQFIEILHYDSIQHIVEGRFQAILGDKPSWAFLPDSMKMTEGKFQLKLK